MLVSASPVCVQPSPYGATPGDDFARLRKPVANMLGIGRQRGPRPRDADLRDSGP